MVRVEKRTVHDKTLVTRDGEVKCRIFFLLQSRIKTKSEMSKNERENLDHLTPIIFTNTGFSFGAEKS